MPETWVGRLAESRLKQKEGYGRHAFTFSWPLSLAQTSYLRTCGRCQKVTLPVMSAGFSFELVRPLLDYRGLIRI